MATVRSRRVSRTFHTSPMPPAPMRARISYGPSLSPTESGIGVIYQVYSFWKQLTAGLRQYGSRTRSLPVSRLYGQ
jgi:hypothetical protein